MESPEDAGAPNDPAGPLQDAVPEVIPTPPDFGRISYPQAASGASMNRRYTGEQLAKTIDAPTLSAQLRDRIASDRARTAKMQAALDALEANPVIETVMTGLSALRGEY